MSSAQDHGGEGAKELEELRSDRMTVVQLDVCSDEQVSRAVDHVRENLPDSEKGKQSCPFTQELCSSGCVRSLRFSLSGLWAVVNNAGVSTFGEVEFTSMDTYKQVSEVNLWGTIRVTKAVLPLIRRAKGQFRLVKQCPHLR